MEEQYISFETAKLAKEKGFRIYYGTSYWKKDGELFGTPYYEFPHDEDRYTSYPRYIAPTQSLLQKWLREFKYYHVYVIPTSDNQWAFEVKYISRIVPNVTILDTVYQTEFPSYELALEAGLIEALNQL